MQHRQREHEKEGESNFAELMSKVLDHALPEAKEQQIQEPIQESIQEPANVEQTLAYGSFDEPAKVLTNIDQPLTTTEQTEDMKQEKIPTTNDEEMRKMLLSKAILDAFGQHSANEIQDNCEFKEITPNKVCIKLAIGVSLNDIEKAKIRKCIQSVYGKNVELVAVKKQHTNTAQEVLNQNEVSRSEIIDKNADQASLWSRFKASYKDTATLAFLDEFRLENCQEENKLVVVGSHVFLDILKGCASTEALENAVLNTGISIELRNNQEGQPFGYDPTINMTPEKILKDREWLKNPRTFTLEESMEEFENFNKRKI